MALRNQTAEGKRVTLSADTSETVQQNGLARRETFIPAKWMMAVEVRTGWLAPVPLLVLLLLAAEKILSNTRWAYDASRRNRLYLPVRRRERKREREGEKGARKGLLPNTNMYVPPV